jgi:hypothetical protein
MAILLKGLRPIMREQTKMFLCCFVFSELARNYRYPIDNTGYYKYPIEPV